MAMYSHSKLSTFEQCAFKYKLRYIDKIKPDIEKSIEALLGTCTHDTLEWVYNTVKENKPLPSLDEVITFYAEEWQKNYVENILIVNKSLTAKDYFNKGVQFLLDYYSEHAPFQDGTIECERRVFIQLDENTKMQGYIDRLVQNQETGAYEVHDYKTAKNMPPQAKMDQDRQLALYSIAVKEQYGHDKEVTLIWHYLAHKKRIYSKRTNEQLTQLKADTLALIKRVESAVNFPTGKTILCNWCEYKTQCPEFNSMISKPDTQQTFEEGPIPEPPPEILESLNQEKPKTIEKQIPEEPKEDMSEFPTISKYIRD